MPICPKCREKNPALGAKCPRDGFYYVYESALEDAETDPRIGTLAAEKYVILGLISEGGMGAVYRALQLPVEREVALKVLRTELQDSNKGRERFIQEARAISRLSHPNIITLHDFGFERETHPYMVMEFAPGVELTRWMWSRKMTAERLLHVGRQILSALAEAHRRDIVHRDLKPENVIITTTGHDGDFPKLLDFGIARLINEGSTRGLTREGEVFGTPHYMSPEQAQGKREIGPQADVYAMGVMFYELFTGEPPFDAEAPLSVLFMHINDPMPTLIPRAGIKAPDWLDGFIAQATKKDPAERYQNAGEMLTALDRLMSGKAPEAHSAAPEPTTEERVAASAPTDLLIASLPSNVADTDPEPPEFAPLAGPAIDDPMAAEGDGVPTDPNVPPIAHTGANTVFLGDDQQEEATPPRRRGLYAALAILILLLLVGGAFMMSRPAPPTTDAPVAAAEPSAAPTAATENAPAEAPEVLVEETPGPVDVIESPAPEVATPESPGEVEAQEDSPTEEPPVEAAQARPEPEEAPAEPPPTRRRETTAEREARQPAETRDEDEGPTKFKSPDSVPRKFGRPPTATN
ncbi:serine/threonine protein kinase [Bradymonadaceae bacterium TMQ3]|uniref:Serine/threonine protein kinase n=1 Tax=Lujinxingia sediminis TaxID=2480984 RepID=A0ABY0CRS5_9DELT|nr:serine/threonine-protein kinase [Lujinxingia sediminis]RDV37883.1 serine/threonine protein kinase [Bradymonadaceae bacterium TMQ3]RVU42784.1 serine/threonine protein kinase [Lujinxingia sediminis]TXC75335.1 protein kinase [Bradymonadales bacterium TMQ1]